MPVVQNNEVTGLSHIRSQIFFIRYVFVHIRLKNTSKKLNSEKNTGIFVV